MSQAERRIWRPSVQANETPVPKPGGSFEQQHQVYTKTSLASNTSSSPEFARLRELNREILSASQAHNSSPRPFNGRASQQQQVQTTSSGHQQEKQTSKTEENMAPKLVHNQYNSPLDLYSMNNIRRTIEAHTELIAPGLKGINFMKGDAPINKQSEVYKLVMEEERRKSPTLIAQQQHQHQQQQQQQHQQQTTTSRGEQPVCCECGLAILGPFARLQNRFIHPHCFNCTTCGTSLKNTGYFTVNEKLYCDIHAKQVARMMRLQFNFEAADDKATSVAREQQVVQQQQQHQQQQRQQVASSSSYNSHSYAATATSLSPPATISTMFADRSNTSSEGGCQQQQQQASRNHHQEIKWAWRPASNNKDTNSCASSTLLSSNLRGASGGGSSQRQVPGGQQSPQQQQQQQLTLTSRPPLAGCSHHLQQQQETLSRAPVCAHCQAQIHGPYVLAGTTTWCKQCSQQNFNCSSCRRSLLEVGFIEDPTTRSHFCEHCFEAHHAPICSRCNLRVKGDCLNALGQKWHPSCFVCGHCRRPFGNSSFYLEDNVPYCERDWNLLFTTKCHACSYPIEAGDKWIEALSLNYHSNCFRCSSCQANLEGSTFYCKGGKPYCRLHAR